MFHLEPYWMAVAATWRCNLHCQNCRLWKTPENGNNINVGEFQLSVADTFFNTIQCVNIFGGEPTLHPDLYGLVQVSAERWQKSDVSIVTNGFDADNIIKMFERLSFHVTRKLLVCVSIDGEEAWHDHMRGQKGSHANAIRTLESAAKNFSRTPRIGMTIVPDSLGSGLFPIEHAAGLARQYGALLSIRVATQGSYFGNPNPQTWDGKSIALLQSKLDKVPNEVLAVPGFVKDIPRYLTERKRRYQCPAYRASMVVNPELGVSCCHEKNPWANLAEIPRKWGRARAWREMASDCECYKDSCFIDGPYALSYLAHEREGVEA